MNLVELTETPLAALPLGALREHLRLSSGFGDDGVRDALLAGFLRAAAAAVEARTAKALLARDFALTLSAWSTPEAQPLPLAPVTVVHAVTVTAADGAEAPLPPSAWALRPDAQRPALVGRAGALPPIPPGGGVRIAFRAGLAEAWGGLPPDLAHAVLMLAAHYHDWREDTGLAAGCMPFGVTALIERFRPLRLGAGGPA